MSRPAVALLSLLIGIAFGIAGARLLETSPSPPPSKRLDAPLPAESATTPQAVHPPHLPSPPAPAAANRAPLEVDDEVPHAEIRGRLIGRDGIPIEGARILAISTRDRGVAGPPVRYAADLATPHAGGAEALTRRGGAFALFGLD